MDFSNVIFKRKFSMTMYKNLRLPLGEMTFSKDFVNDNRGDMYPVLEKSNDCCEKIELNCYVVESGSIERLLGQFFPYATYEMTASALSGKIGFGFILPDRKARIAVDAHRLMFTCGERTEEIEVPKWLPEQWTMMVTCRLGAFDIYFNYNGQAQFWHTFYASEFQNADMFHIFTDSYVSLWAEGSATAGKVCFYMDNGISQADLRPIRFENGEIMVEQGKIYISATIRLREGGFQGIFSWVPGTAQLALTGVLFFDAGDGKWAGDVASSILYHRTQKQWYLWVCSFSHGHILGHSLFEGDPRFGVNVIDIQLMDKAPEDAPISFFGGMEGDEDPDFFYDYKQKKWYMAVCRVDPSTHRYRYVFFESERPFDGYTFIGMGLDGSETGGSFVKVRGEQLFLCGNSMQLTSNYRIYSKDGMETATFDYPDGGFRGWGTLMPVKLGSRNRYFWMTFDRHNASEIHNWSYGNIYCFEADIEAEIVREDSKRSEQRDAEKALQIYEYINLHYTEYDLSIEKVAESMNTNVYAVRKAVLEHSGMKYKDYVVSLRIEYAKSLLMKEEKSVAEIGEMCGYVNIPYFTTLFKEVTGMTPAKYRSGK